MDNSLIELYNRSILSIPGGIIILLIFAAIVISPHWIIFTKADIPGWSCLIPFYGTWQLYKMVFGRGTKMFLLLIPVYNIYWMIKTDIKLAHVFGKSTSFGLSLCAIPELVMILISAVPGINSTLSIIVNTALLITVEVFYFILAFGDSRYSGPEVETADKKTKTEDEKGTVVSAE